MLVSVRRVPLCRAGGGNRLLLSGVGREFSKCHLPPVSSNFRKQTLLRTKYPSAKNEKKGTVPRNLKCNLVAKGRNAN